MEMLSLGVQTSLLRLQFAVWWGFAFKPGATLCSLCRLEASLEQTVSRHLATDFGQLCPSIKWCLHPSAEFYLVHEGMREGRVNPQQSSHCRPAKAIRQYLSPQIPPNSMLQPAPPIAALVFSHHSYEQKDQRNSTHSNIAIT